MKDGKLDLPLICLVAFFAMSAGALLGPVLPFMVEPLNTSREAVGLILGMYTFSTALAMIGVSFVTDRVGRKKILVPCLFINGIAGVACYFSTDMTTLLALRFVQGIGIAGMLPIAMTMIGELYTGLDRVNAMGKMSMTTGIGAVSAPLIGGILASFAWNVPFLFYGLSIPLAIIVAFVLPETNPHEKRSKSRNSIIKALTEFRILYTIILSFSIFFLLYTMVIYVPFILKDNYGFTASQAGLALGIEGIAMATVSSRARHLAAKFGKQKLLMAGFAITGLSIVVSFLPVHFISTCSVLSLWRRFWNGPTPAEYPGNTGGTTGNDGKHRLSFQYNEIRRTNSSSAGACSCFI
ncbi:MAG: MFS transporter [Methanolobus sp.]